MAAEIGFQIDNDAVTTIDSTELSSASLSIESKTINEHVNLGDENSLQHGVEVDIPTSSGLRGSDFMAFVEFNTEKVSSRIDPMVEFGEGNLNLNSHFSC